MKIGVNSRIYQNKLTGIPTYVKNLYEHILNLDIFNNYVFFQTNVKKRLGKTRQIKLKESNFNNVLFDNFHVNKLISLEGVDVFHGPANILPFFKKKGVKYVLTVHDLTFLVNPKQYSPLFVAYFKWLVGHSLNNADLVVADSKSTKKDIIKFYNIDPKKIEVVYPGVNSLFFEPKQKKRLIKDKYFFSLTTHPKRKNIPSIFRVFSQNKKLKDYKYVVAGVINDKELTDLKKQIKDLGISNRVILFGFAKERDLKNLYENAEFFIFPSFYEGFGFPVLEAMACGCPVITSNNSSLKELVPVKKWLVNPYDFNDILSKIDSLLSLKKSNRSKLIKKNLSFAKRFSWDKSARTMIKLFNGLKYKFKK